MSKSRVLALLTAAALATPAVLAQPSSSAAVAPAGPLTAAQTSASQSATATSWPSARPTASGNLTSPPGRRDVPASVPGSGSRATFGSTEVGSTVAAHLAGVGRHANPAARTAAVDRPGSARLLSAARIAFTPCTDDPAFLCGTLGVPLNRRHPGPRTVGLHVEVFPHYGSKPKAAGAVFVTVGGPGAPASIYKGGFAYYLLADIARHRDLVFIDQRGVGQSDVIRCPAFQHGGPFYASAAACRHRLGKAANYYSTTDVADDLEDVRRALGYGQIDLVGGSYAGNDMLSYSVRHRSHVRSVSLASPALVLGIDPFFPYTPKAMPALVSDICRRSPACKASHPHPRALFAWLAARLRHHPVTGTGVDADGVAHPMTVTENLLSNFIMYYQGGTLIGPGEVVQAAAALRHGDKLPLLRLAAAVDPAFGFDGGDPRQFSNGHNLARTCVDQKVVWDKNASRRKRHQQYAAAYAHQPAFYGPISKGALLAPGYYGYQPPPCIASKWQDRPPYPAGTTVPHVPALVFGGEYDLIIPEAVSRRASKVLTSATYVTLHGAPHDPWFYSQCGPLLLQRFIRNLAPGDTSCARKPVTWWWPGGFPKMTAHVPAARQTSGATATLRARRLATVAAWTVMDGIQHNFASGSGTSTGLRGGSVTVAPDFLSLSFDRARFTSDVRVTGVMNWTDVLDGDVTLKASDGLTRKVHLHGHWLDDSTHNLIVTIRVGGALARFAVPAT